MHQNVFEVAFEIIYEELVQAAQPSMYQRLSPKYETRLVSDNDFVKKTVELGYNCRLQPSISDL